MKQNKKFLPEKIVIYSPNQKLERIALRLQEQALLLYEYHKPFLFIGDEARIEEEWDENMLVVSDLDPTSLGDTLFKISCGRFVSWDFFLQEFSLFFQMKDFSEKLDVVLFFLKPSLQKMISNLFALYGFNTVAVNTMEEFEHLIEKSSSDYFVFGMDGIPDGKKKDYDIVIKHFRNRIKQNPYMAISFIKDFSQGNLFDDITAPIRDINNILLSPEEYLIFISHYLQEFRWIESFSETLHKINPADVSPQKQKPQATKKKFSLNLRDGKNCYKKFTPPENKKLIAEHYVYTQQLYMRRKMTEWIETYIQFHEAKKPRSSFTFVGMDAEKDIKGFSQTAKLFEDENEKPIANGKYSVAEKSNEHKH